jgi:hypothetical protein
MTFREPLWEIHLTHRAKTLKPKNQYSFHSESLKLRREQEMYTYSYDPPVADIK